MLQVLSEVHETETETGDETRTLMLKVLKGYMGEGIDSDLEKLMEVMTRLGNALLDSFLLDWRYTFSFLTAVICCCSRFWTFSLPSLPLLSPPPHVLTENCRRVRGAKPSPGET